MQLCTGIRSGKIGRREAQREYRISANLVQFWLTQYHRGELDAEEAAAAMVAEQEARHQQIENCLPRQRGNVSLSNPQVLNAILYVARWKPAH